MLAVTRTPVTEGEFSLPSFFFSFSPLPVDSSAAEAGQGVANAWHCGASAPRKHFSFPLPLSAVG